MFIWSQHLEPIIYPIEETPDLAPMGSYDGIIVDILGSFARENDLDIDVVVTSRKRGEMDLYENRLDFTILSPDWLLEPEKLVFSRPIYKHREFLYGLEPIEAGTLNEAIRDKRVCVRFGYRFKTVQEYFDTGVALRIDSREETLAFKMLEYGRCDFVLTNEFVADAIIEANELQDQIYVSPFLVDEAAFTFAFHPAHANLVDRLNAHIEGLRGSGDLASSIMKHRRKALGFAHLQDEVSR
ncbi:MAG: transporter substrate-binding domain-containing protein [Pseudomonadota bacterium]